MLRSTRIVLFLALLFSLGTASQAAEAVFQPESPRAMAAPRLVVFEGFFTTT